MPRAQAILVATLSVLATLSLAATLYVATALLPEGRVKLHLPGTPLCVGPTGYGLPCELPQTEHRVQADHGGTLHLAASDGAVLYATPVGDEDLVHVWRYASGGREYWNVHGHQVLFSDTPQPLRLSAA